jgi:hypothetical protein
MRRRLYADGRHHLSVAPPVGTWPLNTGLSEPGGCRLGERQLTVAAAPLGDVGAVRS